MDISGNPKWDFASARSDYTPAQYLDMNLGDVQAAESLGQNTRYPMDDVEQVPIQASQTALGSMVPATLPWITSQDQVEQVEEINPISSETELGLGPASMVDFARTELLDYGNTGKVCMIPQHVTPYGRLSDNYNQFMHQAGLSVFRYDTRLEKIKQVELALVEEALCTSLDPTLALEYQAIAPYLNYDALESLLEKEGYLVSVQQNLACILMGLFHTIPEYNPINYARQRIRQWLRRFDQLGGHSIEGIVFSSSLTLNTDILAIKIPRKVDTLVHEALIGLYVTNYVKRWVINFPYTYGYTTCSPMVVSSTYNSSNNVLTSSSGFQTPNIVTWCTTNNPTSSVLVMENINGAMTLSQYLKDNGKDLNTTESAGLMWQIINALAVAGVQCQLTFYDLHLGNILIKWHENAPTQTLYRQGDVNQPIGHIVSNNVLYAIDAGLAHAVVKGQHFGRIGMEKYNIVREHRPIYDLNFLIITWGLILWRIDRNHPALNLLQRIYQIWSPTTLLEDMIVLDKFVPGKGSPDIRRKWLPEYQQFTWPILWERMWNVMTDEEKGFYRPLGTQANINFGLTMDSCRFTSIINTNTIPKEPITFNDSYNALVTLNNGSSMLSGTKTDQISALLKSFNLNEYLKDTGIDQLEEYLNRAEQWLYEVNIPDLTQNPIVVGINAYTIFSSEFYEWYNHQWYYILGIYDLLTLFQTLSTNISTTQLIYQLNNIIQNPLPEELHQLLIRSDELWYNVRVIRTMVVNQILAVRAAYPNNQQETDWEAEQAPYLELTDES